jgi:hypothetical protein
MDGVAAIIKREQKRRLDQQRQQITIEIEIGLERCIHVESLVKLMMIQTSLACVFGFHPHPRATVLGTRPVARYTGQICKRYCFMDALMCCFVCEIIFLVVV